MRGSTHKERDRERDMQDRERETERKTEGGGGERRREREPRIKSHINRVDKRPNHLKIKSDLLVHSLCAMVALHDGAERAFALGVP